MPVAWPWLRRNAVGLVAAGAVMATRAAVRAHSLVTFDAGLHANALRAYDVPSGQPHPPGYPLSVFAGKAVNLLVPDPVDAMVWLSILWTGLTAFLLWRLGNALGGRGAGLGAVGLFAASPVALYNGAVGLTYAADAAMATATACAAWAAGRRPTRLRLATLGAVFAAAVGVRPSAAMFLAPLAAWPLLSPAPARERLRRATPIALAAAAVGAAWLVPMLAFGGGPQAIWSANQVQSRTVVFADTAFADGWPAVRHHAQRFWGHLGAEAKALPWLAAAVAAAAWAARGRLSGLARPAAGRAFFLAVWFLPAALFHTVLYSGWPVYPSGYHLVVLPAACLAVAVPAITLLRQAPRRPARVAAAIAVALLLVPAAFAPAAWREATAPIREADAWAASYAGFDEAFPPETTAIVMLESWPHVKLRHPDHLAFVRARYDHREGEVHTRGIVTRHGEDSPRWFDLLAMDPADAPMHAIPPWVERIALHEGHPFTGPETLVKPEVQLNETTLPTGRAVRWFTPRPEWRAIESYFIEVDPAWSEARLAEQEGRA